MTQGEFVNKVKEIEVKSIPDGKYVNLLDNSEIVIENSKIKYPNDIVIGTKKVSGILIRPPIVFKDMMDAQFHPRSPANPGALICTVPVMIAVAKYSNVVQIKVHQCFPLNFIDNADSFLLPMINPPFGFRAFFKAACSV